MKRSRHSRDGGKCVACDETVGFSIVKKRRSSRSLITKVKMEKQDQKAENDFPSTPTSLRVKIEAEEQHAGKDFPSTPTKDTSISTTALKIKAIELEKIRNRMYDVKLAHRSLEISVANVVRSAALTTTNRNLTPTQLEIMKNAYALIK